MFPYLASIALPVELLQVLVALELADDPVVVEREQQPATDLIPPLELLVPQPERVRQLLAALRRERPRTSSARHRIHAAIALV